MSDFIRYIFICFKLSLKKNANEISKAKAEMFIPDDGHYAEKYIECFARTPFVGKDTFYRLVG